jgi:hypothetical protein
MTVDGATDRQVGADGFSCSSRPSYQTLMPRHQRYTTTPEDVLGHPPITKIPLVPAHPHFLR